MYYYIYSVSINAYLLYAVVYKSSKRNPHNNLEQPNKYSNQDYCFLRKKSFLGIISCCVIYFFQSVINKWLHF